MITLLRRGGGALLDLLFPPRCPGCGRIGTVFCQPCQARIEPVPAPACIRCGRPAAIAGLCPICRATPSNLDRIASSAVFAPPLREAIHNLKYDNIRVLAKPLGLRMASYWQQHAFTAGVIVPVPLHKNRQAERGYNQSALLARVLAQETGIPLDEKLIVRHKATREQTHLNAVERRENVTGAFSCRGDATGLNIVLVDDVCTTGSTLEACAGALRTAGAAGVWAFTLARARGEPGYTGADAR